MIKSVLSALVLSATLFSGVAQAAQVLVLDYRDLEMSGGGSLNLKREIERAYPRLRADNLDLQAVRIVAKSRHGQGSVDLSVGRDSSFRFTINGNPRAYDDRDPRSFALIDINSPTRRSEGYWMLNFRGNIKLRQIQVKVEEDRWGRPGHGWPGDGRPGHGRPGDGRPGFPGDGRPRPGHGPRDDRDNPAKQIIGAIGGIIVDEIGRR